MTKELRKAIMNRSRLRNKYLKNNTNFNKGQYRNHWLERPLVRAPMGALNYLANTQNITRLSAHPLERPWAVRKIYRYSVLLGAK